MAAYAAAKTAPGDSVTILEKMPRPARKIMITGKGRCNFTNVKAWNEFARHIRSKSNFLHPAFYNFPPEEMIAFLDVRGWRPSSSEGTGLSRVRTGPRMWWMLSWGRAWTWA